MRARKKRIVGILSLLAGLSVLALALGPALSVTSPGRSLIRIAFTSYASHIHKGTVEVGELADVGLERWLFRDYRVLDESGREVLRVPELEAHWDASALFTQGAIVFHRAWFQEASMRLFQEKESAQVSLAGALEVPNGKLWVPIEMNGIRLENGVMHLELPGKPALTMAGVSGRASLHIGKQFRFRMDGLRGTIEAPLDDIEFRNMHGRLESDNPRPLLVELTVDVAVDEPRARMEYHFPAMDGKSGSARLELDLPQL